MSQSQEIFSPHGSNPLKKTANTVQRIYSKDAKSNVILVGQRTSKLTLPQDMASTTNTKLNIVERYLVIQINLATSSNTGHIEFTIATQKKQRKRMIFSPSFPKMKTEIFHTQFPFQIESGWHNLCFDLFDLYAATFGETNLDDTYKHLEEIIIGPKCEIRKVFVMQQNPRDEVFIPKKYNFITGVDSRTLVIDRSFYGIMDPQQGETEVKDSFQLPSSKSSPLKVPSTSNISVSGVSKVVNRSHTSQEQPQTAKYNKRVSMNGNSISSNQGNNLALARAKSSNAYVSKTKQNRISTSSSVQPQQINSWNSVSKAEPINVHSKQTSSPNEIKSERNRPYDVSQYQNSGDTPLKRFVSHPTLLGNDYRDSNEQKISIQSISNSKKGPLAAIQTSIQSSRSSRSTPGSTYSPHSEKLFEALKVLEQDQSLIQMGSHSHENGIKLYNNSSPVNKDELGNSFLSEDTPELHSPVLSKSPKPPVDSDDDSNSSNHSEDETNLDRKESRNLYNNQKSYSSLKDKSTRILYNNINDSHDIINESNDNDAIVESSTSSNFRPVRPKRATSPQQHSFDSDYESSDTEEEFSVNENSLNEENSFQHLSQERKQYDKEHWQMSQDSIRDHEDSGLNDTQEMNFENSENDKENVEVSLLYDPLFQCYYDPKSNKYYEAKDVNV